MNKPQKGSRHKPQRGSRPSRSDDQTKPSAGIRNKELTEEELEKVSGGQWMKASFDKGYVKKGF